LNNVTSPPAPLHMERGAFSPFGGVKGNYAPLHVERGRG